MPSTIEICCYFITFASVAGPFVACRLVRFAA
jgi:hypothetical protein